MATVEHLISEQALAVEDMNRILINYKKTAKVKVTPTMLTSRRNNLQKLWEEYQTTHRALLRLVAAAERKANPYFHEDRYSAAQEIYQDVADQLDAAFDAIKHQGKSVRLGDFDMTSGNDDSDLPLARIKVPSFSGELIEWEKFRALFTSVIGDRATLTDAQKLYYLKSSVTGDAALILNRVPYSDTSFQAAWKLLTDEYDNVRNLIYAHLKAFVDIPVMRMETAAELKRLRDTVSSSTALLEALKRPVNKTDDLLIYIVTQKFSKRTRTEWNLRLGGDSTCILHASLHISSSMISSCSVYVV